MDVVVAGGHGKIGLRLLRLLADRGHRARGLIRNPDHAIELDNVGAESVLCDVEERDGISDCVQGADAVVFAAGAGPGSGPERKRTVDYGGAVKLIGAAKENGIDRYLMVSAIKVDRPQEWPEPMVPYYEAKRDADEALMRSGLTYTIVRPGGLTDGIGTGLVEIGSGLESGEIPRDDVAATLLFTLDAVNTYGQAFDVVSGDDPVEDAVRNL
ncbi:MAG TPA: SDR family oxidoreductase [Thermoleophilaceae bacterium]